MESKVKTEDEIKAKNKKRKIVEKDRNMMLRLKEKVIGVSKKLM